MTAKAKFLDWAAVNRAVINLQEFVFFYRVAILVMVSAVVSHQAAEPNRLIACQQLAPAQSPYSVDESGRQYESLPLPDDGGNPMYDPRFVAPGEVESAGGEGQYLTDEPLLENNYFAGGPEPYTIYRSATSAMTFLSGAPGEFGMTSLEAPSYSSRSSKAALNGGIGIHFLSGPEAIDLPPRLYDLSLGYQFRQTAGMFSVDAATSIGLYTDFDGSVREGLRFPSHATGMVHLGPAADLVLGVDYLHRDDIKILPVFGVSLHVPRFPVCRLDLVFPRPVVEVLLAPGKRFCISGELGGGTWDFGFPDGSEDVLTYRDYRILFGLEFDGADGRAAAIELGYVFDRNLEFRSGASGAEFADSFVLRIMTR